MRALTTVLACAAASLGGAAVALTAAGVLAGGRERAVPSPDHAYKSQFAPALATLGDGSAIYTDGTGRLFHLRSGPEGLTLSAVYMVRLDRRRFEVEPALRSPSGYYLDDLAPEAATGLLRAQERFTRESRSGAVDAGANGRLESAADTVLDWGDATFLLGKLDDRSYGARRAAALVLGGAGYAEARKTLAEVAQESDPEGAERARKLLETLPGK